MATTSMRYIKLTCNGVTATLNPEEYTRVDAPVDRPAGNSTVNQNLVISGAKTAYPLQNITGVAKIKEAAGNAILTDIEVQNIHKVWLSHKTNPATNKITLTDAFAPLLEEAATNSYQIEGSTASISGGYIWYSAKFEVAGSITISDSTLTTGYWLVTFALDGYPLAV